MRKLLFLTFVLTLVLSGCGGNDDVTADATYENEEHEEGVENNGLEPENEEDIENNELENEVDESSGDHEEISTDESENEEPLSTDQEENEEVEELEETPSQQNAVSMAQDYLAFTAFSESGLIEQLEFEGFGNEDATYAVDKIDVDWQEQAVIMAQDYLDFSSFSRSGLIEQLEFEGFSNDYATNAVDEVGL
ncbi:Ltp family lipoprotein [Geomicrobium sediminis]|uniref:Putative host cell surface-exposed lipoprotein Ltp-like HTH region domain-containing protein n=1 Tax=Geomicrobium sediminis TaxID=1347788 RepID=A0ABS2P8L3_9BACL|nr:Ltp family lipoprotein [Geomicrobium sediminis]MBM7631747.1 hypothetical protein [Geomicrobium sediminis]